MSRFVLRTGRPRKDGKVTLTFNGYVNGNRIFCGTGLAVRPEDWDDFRQQVRRTDTNYAYVNAKLKEISARFQQEASRIEGSDYEAIDRLRKEFSKRKKVVKVEKPQKAATFWSGYDAFVKAKSTDRGERTIAKYNTLSGILKEFEGGYGKLTFEAMTHNFYDAFKKFLIRKRKLTNNTVGKYVSTLKTFLAWAEERGASIPKDYRKFRVDEEDVAVIALSMDEVRRIENLDVSDHPRLNRVKDLFLFACYTGARFGDIQMLHIDDIHDTVWRLRMGKTRTETLIHLIPQALEILNKYRRFGRMPQISSQRMNDYLKEIGKLADINESVHIVRYQGAKLIEKRGPKWQFLSSHIARKTFVTISLERGMRAEVVMSFTGHRNFKTLKRYIALTQQARGEAIESVWGGA